MNKTTILLVGLVFVVFLVGCQPTEKTIVIESDGTSASIDTLSVSGNGEDEFEPDEAVIRLTIESQAETADNAQNENAGRSDRVIAALKSAGIASGDLETARYTVDPIYTWDRNLEKNLFSGYRARHTLRVTVNNVDKTGTYLDVAVSNGADEIDSVDFTLSDSALLKAKEKVLEMAANSAQDKAKALAKATSVDLVGIRAITESGVNFVPYAAPRYDMALAEAEFGSAPPIQSEKVSVSANVQITYEIG